MTISITRAWLAFAAIGAGMIHLALVVSSPLPLAAAPALLGAAELGWGVAVLARDSLPAPRIALGAAAAGSLGSVAFATLIPSAATATTGADPAASTEIGALPLALAAVLDGVLAALIAVAVVVERRRAASPRRPRVAASTGWRTARSVLAIAAGALVVGAVTTPALAATEAGRQAQPHGAHVMQPEPAPAPGGHAGH